MKYPPVAATKLYRFVTGEHFEEGGYLDGIPSSLLLARLNFIIEELYLDIEDILEITNAWEGLTLTRT